MTLFKKNLKTRNAAENFQKSYSIAEIFFAISVSVMLLIFANRFSPPETMQSPAPIPAVETQN